MPLSPKQQPTFNTSSDEPVKPLSPEEYQKRLRELMSPTAREIEQITVTPAQEVDQLAQQEQQESEVLAQVEQIKINTLETPTQPEPLEEVEPPSQSSTQGENTKETSVFTDEAIEELHIEATTEELQAGLKAPITAAIRWLAQWAQRQIFKRDPEHHPKQRRSLEMVFFEITVPKDNEIEISAAESLYANLTSLYKSNGVFSNIPIVTRLYDPQVSISFEIVAEASVIRFIVATPKELANFVEKQIHAAYPVAEIAVVEEYNIFEKEEKVAYAELEVSGPGYYPIKSHEELKTDGLSAITTAMSKLSEHEGSIVQFVITPVSKSWSARGKSFVHSAEKPPKEGEKPKTVDPEKLEGIKKKVSKVGLGVMVRIVCLSQTQETAKTHLDNIIGSFQQFSHPHLAKFQKRSAGIWGLFDRRSFVDNFLYRSFSPYNKKSVLNIEELATLMHFPNKNIQTPNIKWLSFKRSEPPANLPTEGLYVGYSEFRGVARKIYALSDDRRRHMYILGQTGTGKSEFMMSLAAQDIMEGRGLAFIDPHGDAVEELLRIIPKERAEDVIYFDPGDTERPMGLNILETETEEGKHQIINSFIALLYKLYDPGHTGIIGPQLERAVRNVMLTAMSEPGNSMIEVMRLLLDPEFVKEKLPLVDDPLVKQYWTQQIAQTSAEQRSETLGYFVSKFDRFVTEKMMRNIIGQSKSAFNFRTVMDEGKILLINLAKGRIGEENSQFLGLLYVPRILTAAMSRSNIPVEERKDFYLYVDEFQNFSTPDFAQILSEARKFRLNLIVANQFIAQMDQQVKDAVFGNVGSMITLRAGSDDAQYLESHFAPTFTAKDIMNLTVGNAYVKLLIKGHPSTPFSMYSDYPSWKAIPRNDQLAGMIKELSRLRYGRDKELVEAEIKIRARLED